MALNHLVSQKEMFTIDKLCLTVTQVWMLYAYDSDTIISESTIETNMSTQ